MVEHPSRRWVIRGAKIALLLVIAWFWVDYVRDNAAELAARQYRFAWGDTGLASIVFLAGYVLIGCLWAPLVREVLGLPMRLDTAYRVSAIAWMGRYLPGRVWAVAGKVYLSATDRSQLAGLSMAAALEAVWSQLAGILMAAVIFPFCDAARFLPPGSRWVAVLLGLAGVAGAHPAVFCPVINTLLRLIRQQPLPRRPRFRVLLAIQLGYMATFVLWSAGFALLARSTTSITLADLPLLSAIIPTAWVIGFFMLLAPAGLGVRDSILAVALERLLHTEPSAVVVLVIATRLLTTLIECVCWGSALLMPRLGWGVPPRAPAPVQDP